jgi:hypothetical protein
LTFRSPASKKVSTTASWTYKQQQLKALYQKFEALMMYHATRLDNMVQPGVNPDAAGQPTGIGKQEPPDYKASGTVKGPVLQDLRPEINRNWRENTVRNSTNWRETAAPLNDNNTDKGKPLENMLASILYLRLC